MQCNHLYFAPHYRDQWGGFCAAILLTMKSQIQFLLLIQLVVMLGYLAAVLVLRPESVVSGLTGCLASLIPSVYFSLRMLRHRQVDDASEWLGHAYRSDIGKWVVAGIIFALAFTSGYQWDPVVLFVGYLLVQMSALFLPLIKKSE